MGYSVSSNNYAGNITKTIERRTAMFEKAKHPDWDESIETTTSDRTSASGSNDLLCDGWLIFYEDASVGSEVFMGEGAEAAAKERYKQSLVNWNCHLFRKVMFR